MKVFRKHNYIQVEFSDGSTFSSTENADSLWDFLQTHKDEEGAVKKELLKEELYQGKELLERVKASHVLTLRGNSVYMLDVSELSIPEDFVSKIIEAEKNGDEQELMKFKNFWTLVSLNPDSRVRNNLFWFIRKWNMQITESEDYKEKYLNHKDPYEEVFFIGEQMKNLGEVYDEIVNGADSPIYTDQHSHSTTITLGHPVSIPREECDADQEHSCSRGLHCGAKGWLKQNYYGTVGLMVLVNPANVVAVPTIDEYGKMRTCEYFPVAIIDFDENGDIIESSYSLHSDVAYLKELRYEGDINNNDIDGYEISHTHATREEMYNSILSRLNAN